MLKCYHVSFGCMGLVHGKWMTFASEGDYFEYMKGDDGIVNDPDES